MTTTTRKLLYLLLCLGLNTSGELHASSQCSRAPAVNSVPQLSSAQTILIGRVLDQSNTLEGRHYSFAVEEVLRGKVAKTVSFDVVGEHDTPVADPSGHRDPYFWLYGHEGSSFSGGCRIVPQFQDERRYILIFDRSGRLASSEGIEDESDKWLIFVRQAAGNHDSSTPLYSQAEFLSGFDFAHMYRCPNPSDMPTIAPVLVAKGFGEIPKLAMWPVGSGYSCSNGLQTYIALGRKGDWPAIYLPVGEGVADLSGYAGPIRVVPDNMIRLSIKF